MTSLLNVFDIAGSAMSAQTVRLNTTASNLSNANSIAGSETEVYHAKEPIFQTGSVGNPSSFDDLLQQAAGVRVTDIAESTTPARKEYRPDHPLADVDGYVYMPGVNVVEEMANMISASQSYATNVQVFDTVKQLAVQTLRIGE